MCLFILGWKGGCLASAGGAQVMAGTCSGRRLAGEGRAGVRVVGGISTGSCDAALAEVGEKAAGGEFVAGGDEAGNFLAFAQRVDQEGLDLVRG
jgi:hypothetical protein